MAVLYSNLGYAYSEKRIRGVHSLVPAPMGLIRSSSSTSHAVRCCRTLGKAIAAGSIPARPNHLPKQVNFERALVYLRKAKRRIPIHE